MHQESSSAIRQTYFGSVDQVILPLGRLVRQSALKGGFVLVLFLLNTVHELVFCSSGLVGDSMSEVLLCVMHELVFRHDSRVG